MFNILVEQFIYFGKTEKDFYSLRLSEALKFIEINNKKLNDNYDLNCLFFGQICTTISNFSSNKKRGKTYKIKDFFKTNNKNKYKNNDKMNIERQANYLLMLTQSLGGKVENW